MEKIIHYCWFGGKPLPKLAKKCLASWKKYLPDYKIIEWNESNFDVNLTKFSKQAYDAKSWAFVSDVARIYALKEMGGIYFDTDMIVTKDISDIVKCDVFAGWESDSHVAVGVLGSKKNSEIVNQIWDFYCNNDFSVENAHSLSIPIILTNLLKMEYGLKYDHLHNQNLTDGIVIYSRDYFYPIPGDRTAETMFTDKTCMIHYYVGSWLDGSTKKRVKFQMMFGPKWGNIILDLLVKIKHGIKKILKCLLYPYVLYKRKKFQKEDLAKSIQEIDADFNKCQDNSYVIFYNKNWLGTQNATKELFQNTVGIGELYREEEIDHIAQIIKEKNITFVAFSAFAGGWKNLIKKLKTDNPNITIKVIWHGSHAMNVEKYDWAMFNEIFTLLFEQLIYSIAFVKKSMYDFYKSKGYNVEFIYNTVHVKKNDFIKEDRNSKNVSVGIYASGDRWVKNFYNQFAAASLIDNVNIDCVPINEKIMRMGKIFDVTVNGLITSLPREKLLERMALNDINFYVTFSECAPMIPLESLELGVPCITGNNHHYWDDSELYDYLVVDEVDNVMKIYDKALYCLKNKDKILKMYAKWKKENDMKSEKSVQDFLENRL